MMIGGFAFAGGDIVFVLENWLRLRFMVMVCLYQLILLKRTGKHQAVWSECVCVCVCVFWSLYLVKLINLCSNPDLVKLISIPMKTDCWCWLDTSMAWCATQGCCTLCSTIRSCCIIVSYIFLFSLYDPRCVVCVGVECSDVMELYMDRWGNRHLPMKPV